MNYPESNQQPTMTKPIVNPVKQPTMTKRKQFRELAQILLFVSILSLVCGGNGLPKSSARQDTTISSFASDNQDDQFTPQQIEFFENKIRPLLVEHCFECHSQHVSYAEGSLYLDSRQGLVRGGDSGPTIDLENRSESLFLKAINYDGLFEMPPSSKLPQSEIDLLTEWIKMGAPWPVAEIDEKLIGPAFNIDTLKAEHWCWHPPQSPEVPAVDEPNWNRSTIDRFIYHQLSQQGLDPNSTADRSTLIRRAYFDLIGLPPTPTQVQAFVADKDADAFEKVVDQLLDSPHFGERWARHWMDLVRYAETYGHEFDFPIHDAYQYRDYLIRAFNEDVPYDQFVKEHIAGDLLANPRLNRDERFNESILGTGFWFLGEAVHAPVDVRADQAGRIDNQIDVVTKTFLGLTVACARCHDHKFDAISAADYYALAGFLQSSRRQNLMLDPDQKIAALNRELTGLLNDCDDRAKQIFESFQTIDPTELSQPITALLDSARELAIEIETSHSGSSTESPDLPQKQDMNLLQSLMSDPQRWQSVASRSRIAPEKLAAWYRGLLAEEVATPSHPMFPIRQIVFEWIENPQAELKEIVQKIAGQIQAVADQSTQFRSGSRLFTRFHPTEDANWFTTGSAFDYTQAVAADSVSNSLLLPPGLAHSGRLGSRQHGVLRSPTFIIEHPQIHYRLLAEKVKIRLIIDGFEMDIFQPLLFEGMAFDPDTKGKFVWQTQAGALQNYLGHRAYIEIIDQGDGFGAVDEIWFSNGLAPTDPPSPLAEKTLVWLSSAGDELSHEVAVRLAEELLSDSEELISDQVAMINWMIEHQLTPSEITTMAFDLRRNKARLQQVQQNLPFPRMAVGITDGSPIDEYLFIRGNHRNLGPVVQRDVLTALRSDNHPEEPEFEGSGRLYWAETLTSPDHPLTSRVIVNRLWQHLMGRGIVPSVDNFGVLGETPSHPELLDYLAIDFAQNGWSIKRTIKQIMLSRVYQLASESTEINQQRDPDNRWYHRANVRRLEGEAIRDAMLFLSGNLDPTLFGPSIPVHLTSFMQGRGRPHNSGPLDGNGRRSIYQEVRRNFLSPFMLAFDTPIPFNTIGQRTESNVPAQALILLNSPFVQQQARDWAEKILANDAEVQDRIESLYQQAFARSPSEMEIEQGVRFLQTQAAARNLPPDAMSHQIDLWADYCHVLFNTKEFIFIR